MCSAWKIWRWRREYAYMDAGSDLKCLIELLESYK
jgi:hypothetical protein